ncbi:MAG: hypothetical protein IT477_10555 [Rhodanobacteraceae bacterium]|nr:hypothetical protein [Rhodanobacteraceae bacterium]
MALHLTVSKPSADRLTRTTWVFVNVLTDLNLVLDAYVVESRPGATARWQQQARYQRLNKAVSTLHDPDEIPLPLEVVSAVRKLVLQRLTVSVRFAADEVRKSATDPLKIELEP